MDEWWGGGAEGLVGGWVGGEVKHVLDTSEEDLTLSEVGTFSFEIGWDTGVQIMFFNTRILLSYPLPNTWFIFYLPLFSPHCFTACRS